MERKKRILEICADSPMIVVVLLAIIIGVGVLCLNRPLKKCGYAAPFIGEEAQ